MSARDLVRALESHGIHVAYSIDGNDMHDGALLIGGNVHVQVPTFGEPPRVICDAYGHPGRCYPPRDRVDDLAADIRDALDEVPLVLASSSIH